MEIDMESVGNRIKNRRKEMQLTQTDIFNMCSIRSGALSRIENGTSVPSVILFYRIAQIWLLTGGSSNMENFTISKNEEAFLEGFRELSEDDQEELIGLLEMKLRKTHKVRETSAKSSGLTNTEKGSKVG